MAFESGQTKSAGYGDVRAIDVAVIGRRYQRHALVSGAGRSIAVCGGRLYSGHLLRVAVKRRRRRPLATLGCFPWPKHR